MEAANPINQSHAPAMTAVSPTGKKSSTPLAFYVLMGLLAVSVLYFIALLFII